MQIKNMLSKIRNITNNKKQHGYYNKEMIALMNSIIQNQEKINEQNEAMLRDIQIRVNDIQDRAYDLLWQQKTKTYQRDLMFWQLYKKESENIKDAKLRFFKELPKATGNARKMQLVINSLLSYIKNVCEQNNIPYWLDFGTLIGAYRHQGFIPWDDDIDIGMIRKDAEKLMSILQGREEIFVRAMFLNRINEPGVIRVFQVRWADTEKGPYKGFVDIFYYDYCELDAVKNWEWMIETRKKMEKDSIALPQPVKDSDSLKQEVQNQYKTLYDTYNVQLQEKLKISDEPKAYIVWGFDNFNYIFHADKHIVSRDTIFPLNKMEFEGEIYSVPNHYEEYISKMYEDILALPSDMLAHKHVELSERNLACLEILYKKYCLKRGVY